MSEALMLQAFRVDHMSVRTCEQWPHTWMDFYAVWDGEWGRARKRCTGFWWWSSKGKGQFGVNKMQKWRVDRLSTRVWKIGSISVRTVYRWILRQIPFLMIQSGSRSKWSLTQNSSAKT